MELGNGTNIEPRNEGGWKMMFLFIWVIFRFDVNFQGVYVPAKSH